MFGFLKRAARFNLDEEMLRLDAEVVLRQEDKGQILDRLPNDEARYRMCVRWAEEARNKFYGERRLTIARIITSRSIQFRPYSGAAREKIGERIWGESLRAKELIGLEQMYGRWASVYKAGPESR